MPVLCLDQNIGVGTVPHSTLCSMKEWIKNRLCHHADGLVRRAQGIHSLFPLILFKRSILVGSLQKSQVPDSVILALGGISVKISSILNIDSASASRTFCTRAC